MRTRNLWSLPNRQTAARSAAEETNAGRLPKLVQVDEGQLRGHVQEVVRSTVEEIHNSLLDAEVDALCRAKRYERSPEWADTRREPLPMGAAH